MTREIAADYLELETYVENYCLKNSLANPSFSAELKSIHKRYYSMLSWSSELNFNKSAFQKMYSNATTDISNRIIESVNDIGSAYFNWINGNYKTARVMLRVSIENFLRATSAIEDRTQLTEKSVYDLFDKAKNLNIIKGDKHVLGIFSLLRSTYKLLCKDVHSESLSGMGNISSLSHFPSYDTINSSSDSKLIIKVITEISTMFCLLFKSFFHSMYHRNKESILITIPKKYRPIIHGV